MKSPDNFDEVMFAPCGVNCLICYMHANPRKYGKSCRGCFSQEQEKAIHCRRCRIKKCTEDKGLSHCFNCTDMPCKLIKNLDKSYRQRYGVSIVENCLSALKNGIIHHMLLEKEIWTCRCNGLISLQDGVCSECKTRHRENPL